MDISYYYQILDIGILFEKGRKNGKLWRRGERRRLREEILFWQNILNYISNEEKQIECSEELFESLEQMCKKYKFPNYERILENKEELVNSNCVFERNKDEELKIRSFMKQLLLDMQANLDNNRGKETLYRILGILHNLPKAMHGKNILNNSCNLISYKDALAYAQGCMNEKEKEEYGKFLL